MDIKLADLRTAIPSLTAPVVTVKETETLLFAYQELIKSNVHGLGVVDNEGRLSGNLSAWDLKYLKQRSFVPFLEPVKKFLINLRNLHQVGADFVIGIKLKHTIRQCMQRMVTAKVHRLFIVDDDLKPIGVITNSDLIRLFIGLISA